MIVPSSINNVVPQGDRNSIVEAVADVSVITAVYSFSDPSTVEHVFKSNKELITLQEKGLPAFGVSSISLSDELLRLELIENVIEINDHNLDDYEQIEVLKKLLSHQNPSLKTLTALYEQYVED